jgi:hypothetical protein
MQHKGWQVTRQIEVHKLMSHSELLCNIVVSRRKRTCSQLRSRILQKLC